MDDGRRWGLDGLKGGLVGHLIEGEGKKNVVPEHFVILESEKTTTDEVDEKAQSQSYGCGLEV